jgi:hypothetical protein
MGWGGGVRLGDASGGLFLHDASPGGGRGPGGRKHDGTKPKCADWRMGTPGPRKRAVAAVPREMRNKANFG